jgi:hypothetical protein
MDIRLTARASGNYSAPKWKICPVFDAEGEKSLFSKESQTLQSRGKKQYRRAGNKENAVSAA